MSTRRTRRESLHLGAEALLDVSPAGPPEGGQDHADGHTAPKIEKARGA